MTVRAKEVALGNLSVNRLIWPSFIRHSSNANSLLRLVAVMEIHYAWVKDLGAISTGTGLKRMDIGEAFTTSPRNGSINPFAPLFDPIILEGSLLVGVFVGHDYYTPEGSTN